MHTPSMNFQSVQAGMYVIFLLSVPFQICNVVICLRLLDVINFWFIIGVRNESLGNQSMYISRILCATAIPELYS